jgi:3-oxoacyl-[acyl-carrier protein] reductase
LVVVGASRGLGAGVVRYFAKNGWAVSFGARGVSQLIEIETELRLGGCEVSQFHLDVSDERSVEKFFLEAEQAHGEINAVVHLAAALKPFGSVRSVDPVTWTDTVHTNINGTFYVIRCALMSMPAERRGDIVVLSGGGATSPMPTISAYAASKSAVVRLVESVALEEKDGLVRINALAPGIMDTDMLDELIDSGRDLVSKEYFVRMQQAKLNGEDSKELAIECIEFLLTNNLFGLSGLLISAKWDDWKVWEKSGHGDFHDPMYRLRRISSEDES